MCRTKLQKRRDTEIKPFANLQVENCPVMKEEVVAEEDECENEEYP